MGWLHLYRPPSTPTELPSTTANTTAPAFALDADDTHVVSSDDVIQGNVGDCYLMASLRALAQTNPEQLQSLIRDDGRGGFNVRLYSDAEKAWKTYHVGRHELGEHWRGSFNRTGSDGTPTTVTDPALSAASSEGDIWVRILEVAYAKHLDAHDSSAASGLQLLDRGGRPANAMTALTGQPAEVIGMTFTLWGHTLTKSAEYVGQQLADALAQNRPATLSTVGSGKKEGLALNFVGNHAYPVEAVRREEGTGRYIVKLANPWGWKHPKSDPLRAGEIYLDDALNQGLISVMELGAPQARQHPPMSSIQNLLMTQTQYHALAA